MIIRIGSLRPAKVDGAREALDAIARVDARFERYALEPYDLTAIAPRQPMSLGEILDGARARAAALMEPASSDEHMRSTFGVGLEGGLHEVRPGCWALASWAAVTDGLRWGYGAGPSIVLPDGLADRVRGGEELGDVIDAMAGESVRGTRGAWGILTRDLVGRRDAFRLAVLAAFAPFYNGGVWGRAGADVADLDSRSD